MNLIFPKVVDLVELIKVKGKGCFLFKRYLKRVYIQIPVDRGDVPLLGYMFENQVFFDKYFSMGLSRPPIFVSVSQMLSFICAGYWK